MDVRCLYRKGMVELIPARHQMFMKRGKLNRDEVSEVCAIRPNSGYC